jgi:hypothetical protein
MKLEVIAFRSHLDKILPAELEFEVSHMDGRMKFFFFFRKSLRRSGQIAI